MLSLDSLKVRDIEASFMGRRYQFALFNIDGRLADLVLPLCVVSNGKNNTTFQDCHGDWISIHNHSIPKEKPV